MTDFEFAKIINKVIKKAESEACGKMYIIKPDVIRKLNKITQQINCDYSVKFDATFNAIDIRLNGYVLDSKVSGIREAILYSDVFVIDAECDGKVCVELRVLNAANIV